MWLLLPVLRPGIGLIFAAVKTCLQVDDWAIGAITYELFTGRPPFDHDSRTVAYKRIMHEEPVYGEEVPQLAADFIRKSLVKVRQMVRACRLLIGFSRAVVQQLRLEWRELGANISTCRGLSLTCQLVDCSAACEDQDARLTEQVPHKVKLLDR